MAITKIGTPELFDFSATNTALQLPTGDTASRPAAPSAGEWRFNTDKKYVEFWDGGAWRQIDTEALPNPVDFPSQNFNVSTYFGNGSSQTIDAKFNEAANFNGSSSKIVLPSYGTTFDNNFSVSLWFNINTIPSSGIISFITAQADNYFYCFLRDSDKKIETRVEIGGTGHVVKSSTTFSNNSGWYQVSVTKSSTAGLKLYVNGSLENSDATATGNVNSETSTSLLGAYGNTQYYLNGKIDQVRIFNTVLTDAQAEDLYTDETTTTAATLNFPAGAGCVAAYQLDGDASDVGGTYGGVTTDIGYTGLKFQADLIWIKARKAASDHTLTDSVRGVQQLLSPNTDALEGNQSPNGMTNFGANSFSVTDVSTGGAGVNGPAGGANSGTPPGYVAWCFKGGGAPNTDNIGGSSPTPDSIMVDGSAYTTTLTGTIFPKRATANTAAGFSIINYDGSGISNGTLNHFLSAAPELYIWKRISSNSAWSVAGKDINNYQGYIELNDSGIVNPDSTQQAPTSSLIKFNTSSPAYNGTGQEWMLYVFHSVSGYQKIGSYTGNGGVNTISTEVTSGDGGFEPAWIMYKAIDSSNKWWVIRDNKRGRDKRLYANEGQAENSDSNLVFLTNGFQLQDGDSYMNGPGVNYIYLAIAADKDSSVPTAANSFKTSLYTGNGGTQNIYTPFAPDFTWLKERSGTQWHSLYDSIRGVGNRIVSNSSNAQNNDPNRLTSFNPNGFSIGTDGDTNTLNDTYISWNWKAGGLPTINNDGTNITSIVSANQAAGFSIVKYTGIGSTASVGHGLGVAPTLIIAKCLDITSAWVVYSVATGVDKFIELNDNTAATTATGYWGTSAPTASVFEVNNGNSNNNSTGNRIIAYCFANSTGYQQAGTYSGSSSSVTINFDGAGFNPSFVMIRRTNATGQLKDWTIFDQSLSGSTTMNDYLVPNSDAAEFTNSTSEVITATSTGFTIAGGVWDGLNASGGEYLYLAVK